MEQYPEVVAWHDTGDVLLSNIMMAIQLSIPLMLLNYTGHFRYWGMIKNPAIEFVFYFIKISNQFHFFRGAKANKSKLTIIEAMDQYQIFFLFILTTGFFKTLLNP